MQHVAERGASAEPVSEMTFADLLKPLVEPGFRLALAMLHDAAAAEDAVQDASLTAWRKVGKIKDPTLLRPWFLGVVANQCRNARRRKWFSDVRLGLPDEAPVSSAEDKALRGADLRRALARLRHGDRL